MGHAFSDSEEYKTKQSEITSRNKKKVINAYMNQRLSETQISEALNVAPKTVRRIIASSGIQKRTISEAIRCLHITKFNKEEFVLKPILTPSDEALKIAAVMLYWGEGSKRGCAVALSNSDPEMIRIFARFLRDVCGICESRLHMTIHYYEDHNPEELTRFWSTVATIPTAQFYKPVLHKRRPTGTYRNPSKYGTALLQYADTKLLALIKEWMTGYRTALLNEERPV